MQRCVVSCCVRQSISKYCMRWQKLRHRWWKFVQLLWHVEGDKFAIGMAAERGRQQLDRSRHARNAYRCNFNITFCFLFSTTCRSLCRTAARYGKMGGKRPRTHTIHNDETGMRIRRQIIMEPNRKRTGKKEVMSSLHAWEKRSQVTYSIRAFSYRAHSARCCRHDIVFIKLFENVNFVAKLWCAHSAQLHTLASRSQPPSSSSPSPLPFNWTDVAPESGALFDPKGKHRTDGEQWICQHCETCQTHDVAYQLRKSIGNLLLSGCTLWANKIRRASVVGGGCGLFECDREFAANAEQSVRMARGTNKWGDASVTARRKKQSKN